MIDKRLKTVAYAAPTKWLKDILKQAKAAGYETTFDKDAGTATAEIDGVVYLRAMQTRSRWIVRADPAAFSPVED